MRILIVAGARPNFMKVAPILTAAKRENIASILVHTGQHYDADMSDSFFSDLHLPAPDYHLGVGSGSHAVQTAKVMEAFEPVLLKEKPDWVVVVGDVNSTLAAALVTSKLKETTGSQLAHVEAGLRSNDWRMPEEVNRVLTDRLSDRLFIPSWDAKPNLLREGIPEDRIRFAGNVMIDTLHAQLPAARESDVIGRLGLDRGKYVIVTLHRPSNVDDRDRLRAIFAGLTRIAQTLPVVFPMHPRTRRNTQGLGLGEALEQLRILEPLGYREMLSLVDGASVVLTDSGGLQEETTVLGVPCVTLREATERPITVTEGTNRLIQWPPTANSIVDAFQKAVAVRRLEVGTRAPEGWDGKASERILRSLAGT